jgi:hypothetical protein
MCNPLALVSGAIGGLQAHNTYQGQKAQAKVQEKMQLRASIQEQQRHLQEMTAMRTKERQEAISAAQQRGQITKQAREARATARVSSGEAGVSGNSVDALMNAFTQNEATALFSITQQEEFMDQNRALGITDAQMRTTGNLLRINKPIAKPDLFGAVLSGAQTGMSMYSFGKDMGFGAPKAAGTKNIPINNSLYKGPKFP